MKYFKSYCKDRLRAILGTLAAAGVLSFVFFLYDLPAEPLLYGGVVTLALLLLLFAAPDYLSYRRRAKEYEALRRGLLAQLDFPELSATLQERELSGMIRALFAKLREDEALWGQKQKETMDYYTLWVHQVKTPLSAMRLILQSEEQTESVTALLQELFKVERYVEMVLGYLRLDSMNSDLRLERCSLHEIAAAAVRKFAPQFIYQKLSLEFADFDNVVLTDEKWLGFVIEQLLSNALKYTKTGGVSIYVEAPDVLVIEDTGIGISEEDLPRIFERGFTGFNGRQGKNSSGLGLYLTKQVLNRLQTKIEIRSEQEQGTKVLLYLHRDELAQY